MKIDKFIEELNKLNVNIDDDMLNKLNRYYELLVEWNEKMNLTGITEKEEVYLKHFYDSLTISKVIDLTKEETLCDIGTGAGFPGMVLKIVFPNLKITLVDSLNKRLDFLNEVIKDLNLKDIETIHARAEEYAVTNREIFDVVTARAVASLPILLEYTMPLVKVNKYFIAMKANAIEEIENSKNALIKLSGNIEQISQFILPIEESNRTIIKVIKKQKTNNIYPRKYSEMKKKPL